MDRNTTIAALTKAGIPADRHEEVFNDLAEWFDAHAAVDALETPPADSREKMLKVLKLAQKLEGALKALSDAQRLSLGTLAQGFKLPNGKVVPQNFTLTEPAEWFHLNTLIAQAMLIVDGTHRGRGRPDGALGPLLFQMLDLWDREMPGSRGVISDGRGDDSDDRYSGPLLDLVESLFENEGIEFKSRDALGHKLYTIISEIAPQ